MAVINARKYDPTLPLEKQLEASMSPEELKRWQSRTKPHYCDPPSLKEGELGPGTIWSCDDCGAQKKVVHMGIAQETEVIEDGKRVIVPLPPLGWRNLALGSR